MGIESTHPDAETLEGEEDERGTTLTQAERIISRFNGPRNLAAAIGRDVATVYKWTYPKNKGGTGGIIPSSSLRKVLDEARRQGIWLNAEDLYPGRH